MAEKGQAGQAHEGGCCFFPAQQLTLQGRGASLSSLSPSHSCCQLQAQHLPQSVSLLYLGCDSKTAVAKIIIFQTAHLQTPARWVWNWLPLMHLVSHPEASISSCFRCLLLAPSLGFDQHLFSLDAILYWALRFLLISFPWKIFHVSFLWKTCYLLGLYRVLISSYVREGCEPSSLMLVSFFAQS